MVQTPEWKIPSLQLTSGFLAASSSYLLFTGYTLLECEKYLTRNFDTLQRNCSDVFQSVFEIANEGNNTDIFSVDVKFNLFSEAASSLAKLLKVFDKTNLEEFAELVKYRQSVFRGIALVPYFDDL